MIELTTVKKPELEKAEPVILSDETMEARLNNVIAKMEEKDLDTLVVYADLEHGNNFEYLVGFLPRFEEALLVLHKNKEAYLVLGNENLNKCSKARLQAKPVHLPHFSLPNQPMKTELTVAETLAKTGLQDAEKIGIVGWKNFTSALEDNEQLFDLPNFVIKAIDEIAPDARKVNAADIFVGENGVRTVNNANEAAHYEYGAVLAGNCMLNAMEALEAGKTEREVGAYLDGDGQTHSVVTIMATGSRFDKANMYPSNKVIKEQDPLSLTSGYKGGLQSRAGVAVSEKEELPEAQSDYLERVAAPYFNAVAEWLENIHVGMKGDELYDKIEEVLPKDTYGWSLNPGHLCADEEWLSSPIYPNSKEELKSGMLFQIDVIPSVTGYPGISCESGVLLADEELRNVIKEEYPELYQRFLDRQKYMREELGINISDEVLPTSMMTAYCRPLMLNKEKAFKKV